MFGGKDGYRCLLPVRLHGGATCGANCASIEAVQRCARKEPASYHCLVVLAGNGFNSGIISVCGICNYGVSYIGIYYASADWRHTANDVSYRSPCGILDHKLCGRIRGVDIAARRLHRNGQFRPGRNGDSRYGSVWVDPNLWRNSPHQSPSKEEGDASPDTLNPRKF